MGFHFSSRYGGKFKYPFWRSHLAWTASTLYRSVFSAERQRVGVYRSIEKQAHRYYLSTPLTDHSLPFCVVWTFSARSLSLCERTAFSSVYNCEIRERRDRKRETSTDGLVDFFYFFLLHQAGTSHLKWLEFGQQFPLVWPAQKPFDCSSCNIMGCLGLFLLWSTVSFRALKPKPLKRPK